MAFKFTSKQSQKFENFETKGLESEKDNGSIFFKPSASPEKIQYIKNPELEQINERAFDDLTGASYISDGPSWSCKAATYLTAGIAYGVTTVVAGAVTKNPTVTAGAGEAAAVFSGATVRASCDDDFRLLNPTNETGVFDFTSPNNNSEGSENPSPDTDTDPGSDDNDTTDTDSADSNDEGGIWDSIVEFFTGDDDADAEAGGDEGNPNPYEDGSQGSTSKPTIGPAPGDIGGRYDSVLNPGSDRGFTPGNDDNGDGNPGNPWDRNERMSTPNDDGDSIDPVTGLGGGSNPSGPRDGVGGDPEDEDNGVDNELFRPNPEDDFGTGLSFVIEAVADFSSVGVENLSDDAATSITQAFVATLSAEAVVV